MKKIVDVFPAIIKLAPPDSLPDFTMLNTTGEYPKGTRKLDRCRAVMIGDVLTVVIDSPEGPKIVFRELVEDHQKSGKVHHFLTTSRKIIAISKDENCGCGSRLRSWNPYGSFATSTEDPT